MKTMAVGDRVFMGHSCGDVTDIVCTPDGSIQAAAVVTLDGGGFTVIDLIGDEVEAVSVQ